jgi:flagella basal body P-ring formation protein FlgA
LIRILMFSIFMVSSAFATEARESQALSFRLSNLIRSSLSEKIAGAEIRTPSFARMMSIAPMSNFSEISHVRMVNDRLNGAAQFEVTGVDVNGQDCSQVIQSPYEAWRKVPVAIHRIFPNTKLKNEDFRIQGVNIAIAPGRDYQGVMFSATTDFSAMQTRQTILEGQYVISSAVEKTPDVRKGDSVRLDLISGDLTLTTQAVIEESASIGSHVRVMTTKTKRELTGLVRADRSVEVTL